MAEYKNILVATDLHDDALPVVREALAIAKKYEAKLSVISVVPTVPYYLASGLSSIADIENQLNLETRARLESAKEKLKSQFQAQFDHLDFYLEKGSAKQEIVRLSEKLNADLIVIGSHGHRGVQRFLGSTSSAVLHRANCDVLVVRAKR
jgi:universal stress protein A